MSTTLKQIGGQVRIDHKGRNFGYFDRSQVEIIYNGLSNTVSITCQGAGSINTASVAPGGVFFIETVSGGLVDISGQSLFDINFALLFPNEGSGSGLTLTEGQYSPVFNNIQNLTSITSYDAFYTRIGSTVTIYGYFDLDIIAISTLTQFTISIPINTTNWTQPFQAAGSFWAVDLGTDPQGGAFYADIARPGEINAYFAPKVAGLSAYSFQLSYKIF